MNELHKYRLSALDEVLIQALYALFNEELQRQFPKVGDETNEVLGEKLRAYNTAKEIIDKAFDELNILNIQKSQVRGFNKEL